MVQSHSYDRAAKCSTKRHTLSFLIYDLPYIYLFIYLLLFLCVCVYMYTVYVYVNGLYGRNVVHTYIWVKNNENSKLQKEKPEVYQFICKTFVQIREIGKTHKKCFLKKGHQQCVSPSPVVECN